MNALYVICGLGFLTLVAEITSLRKGLTLLIVAGLLSAGALIVSDWNTVIHYYGDMVVFDNFAISFTTLIIGISLFWFWMAGDYFRSVSHQTDRSALILFSITGAIIMVSFNNMTMLFLGIEILSISMYTLAGSHKESLLSNEAAFKYFLMGSFATGFLLMGIALVYGATGSFSLTTIAAYLTSHSDSLPAFFYAGVLLILAGMAFKISAVPFHFWAPDVYEGSPTIITAFMSTVVKIGAIGAFLRLYSACFVSVHEIWTTALQVITVLTLLIPNITAVYQQSVKRMLAYSSIGHVGYILLAFLAGGAHSSGTIFYYLAAYGVASITAFSVLQKVEENHGFNGLSRRSPILAVSMTVALLSLAGIPPLAGFFGKYMVLRQAMEQGYQGLVMLAVLTSVVGVYYYFKVIISIFSREPDRDGIPLSISYRVLVTLLLLITFIIGVFPDLLISLFI